MLSLSDMDEIWSVLAYLLPPEFFPFFSEKLHVVKIISRLLQMQVPAEAAPCQVPESPRPPQSLCRTVQCLRVPRGGTDKTEMAL